MVSETHNYDKRPHTLSRSDQLWRRGPTRHAEPDDCSLDFGDTMRELGLTLGGICAVIVLIIFIVEHLIQ